VVGHTTKQMKHGHLCDNRIWWSSVENVALGLHPRLTFSTSGPSYLDVGLTTMHHLYNVTLTDFGECLEFGLISSHAFMILMVISVVLTAVELAARMNIWIWKSAVNITTDALYQQLLSTFFVSCVSVLPISLPRGVAMGWTSLPMGVATGWTGWTCLPHFCPRECSEHVPEVDADPSDGRYPGVKVGKAWNAPLRLSIHFTVVICCFGEILAFACSLSVPLAFSSAYSLSVPLAFSSAYSLSGL